MAVKLIIQLGHDLGHLHEDKIRHGFEVFFIPFPTMKTVILNLVHIISYTATLTPGTGPAGSVEHLSK